MVPDASLTDRPKPKPPQRKSAGLSTDTKQRIKSEAFTDALSKNHLAPSASLDNQPAAVVTWLHMVSERVDADMEHLTKERGMRPLEAVRTLVVGVALFGFKVGRGYQRTYDRMVREAKRS